MTHDPALWRGASAAIVATDVSTAETYPTDMAIALPGRFGSCLINPPLVVTTEGVVQTQQGGTDVLRPNARVPGTAVLMAYGPNSVDPYQSTTLVLDELTVTPNGATSSTGQAWKLYEQQVSAVGIRLSPRQGDYSVCKVRGTSVSAKALDLAIGRTAAQTSGAFGWRGAPHNVAAATALDIFGIEPDAYVRLQLSSDPTGANILIGNDKQSAITDTILDILASYLPYMRLEKAGFVPCTFDHWSGRFEPGSRRVLDASCKLERKRVHRK